MPENVTLLDRAKKDLKNSIVVLQNADDEMDYDVSGYLLQQSVEKVLRFLLAMRGEEFPFTHDIEKLAEFADKKGINIPDWIWENAITLTNYATNTRYGKQLVVTKRRLELLHPKVQELIDSVELPKKSDGCLDKCFGFPQNTG